MENSLGNKKIMAKNIVRLMEKKGVNASEVCKTLGFPNATFSDWINAKTYPRIDKIEKMAVFFGVGKRDLVEEYETIRCDETIVLTETEHELVGNFKKLSELNKGRVLQYVDTLLENQKEKRESSSGLVG